MTNFLMYIFDYDCSYMRFSMPMDFIQWMGRCMALMNIGKGPWGCRVAVAGYGFLFANNILSANLMDKFDVAKKI